MQPDAVVNAFLRRTLADQAAGGLRPLAQYQALWPGHDALIASEYAGLAADSGLPDASAGEAAARRIGGYRILRELGEGGQGRVYLAEDERLRRQVALKLLIGLGEITESALLRFRREAEIASRLTHPGLCTVYGAGVEGGVPYIAMRYVPGETLAMRLARAREQEPITPLRIHGAIELVAKAARALHAAHEAGIVHRDVKPANVMITPDGEPVILDFGVARTDDAGRATLTATGDILGTPAYMSPEQVEGAAAIDRRADVWSLGAVLYECLTLRRPFEEPTREALYRSIVTSEPRPVRRLNPAIPKDLEVVVSTALAKPLGARYQTALDVAEDLDRVRDHVPIRARRAGPWTRLARWTRRNPAIAAVAAALLVSLAAGLAVALHLLGVAREERDEKGAALVKARVAALSTAAANVASADPALRLILAREAARLDPTLGRRALREAIAASFETARLGRHYGPVTAARWSPDGRRVLTASRDGTAIVWDADGGRLFELRGHEGAVLDAAWSEDGSFLVTGSDDGTARLWARDGALVAVLEGHEGPVRKVGFAGGGSLLTVSESAVRLWSADGRIVRVLGGSDGPLAGAWFDRERTHVTTASRSGVVRRLDQDGAVLAAVDLGVPCDVAATSPSGATIALGAKGGALFTVALPSGARKKLEGHPGLTVLSWAPDGTGLLTGSSDGTARVWGENGELRRVAIGSGPAITAATWCEGGDAFVVGTDDGWIRRHGAAGGAPVALGRHDGAVLGCEPSPDGRRFVTRSRDGTARVLSLDPREPWFVPIDGGGRGTLGPDGRLEVLNDATRVMVDVRGSSHRILAREEAPPGSRFVPGTGGPPGVHLVVSSGRCAVRDFDGRTLATFDTGIDVRTASVSADGATVIVRDPKALNEMLDLKTGTRRPFPATLSPVVFSPDGRILAATDVGPCALDRDGHVVSLHSVPGGDAEDAVAEISVSPGGRFTAFRTTWHWLLVLQDGGPPIQHKLGASSEVRLAWSPSVDRLLCAGVRTGVQILELRSGELRPVGPPVDALLANFLSEDRVAIASTSSIDFWDVGNDRVVDAVATPSRTRTLVVDRSRGRLYAITNDGVLGLGFDDRELLRLAESMPLRDFTLDERIMHCDLLGPENGVAIRALRFIRDSLAVCPLRSEVLARAASDPGLDAPVRAAVASLLPSVPEDSGILNEFTWERLKKPGADRNALAQALRAAETLVHCVPASGAWLNTLGIARFRTGDFAGAEADLRRSDAMNRRQMDPLGIGEDLAVLAMAEHRLGRSSEATLDRLRSIIAARPLRDDERAFVGELEALIGRPVGSR